MGRVLEFSSLFSSDFLCSLQSISCLLSPLVSPGKWVAAAPTFPRAFMKASGVSDHCMLERSLSSVGEFLNN